MHTVQLIDVAIPSDFHVAEKETEKINKYQDLRVELEWLWKMRTSIVPVIIGPLGCISQNFDKFVENLTLPSVNKYVLKKSALLGSA